MTIDEQAHRVAASAVLPGDRVSLWGCVASARLVLDVETNTDGSVTMVLSYDADGSVNESMTCHPHRGQVCYVHGKPSVADLDHVTEQQAPRTEPAKEGERAALASAEYTVTGRIRTAVTIGAAALDGGRSVEGVQAGIELLSVSREQYGAQLIVDMFGKLILTAVTKRDYGSAYRLVSWANALFGTVADSRAWLAGVPLDVEYVAEAIIDAQSDN